MQDEATSIQPGQFVISGIAEGGDLPDYEILVAEEPIKVHIADIKTEMGRAWGDGEEPKQQLRFVFKVSEGQDGAGQTYSKWVNAPSSNFISPKSGLFKILDKVYPNGLPENFELTDAIGQPLRIELSTPYDSNGKQRQRVEALKSPTKDQKAVEVARKDIVIGAETDVESELAKVFG